ncbi:MAG TPA: 7-cyano-7-deazaguanine synthase [Candidatus Dormibacteraeota bacterium]|nr:7-cyano-7-deazaguanine synthase [Candidatus Dormibacteraeota bacterium]
MELTRDGSVCVLLSGGIDSAACVAFYLVRGFQVRALHVDYNQPAARNEEAASAAIAKHYNVERLSLRLRGAAPKSPGLIYGRNGMLLLIALMELRQESSLFATGIHAGTRYADCSQSFVRAMQGVFDLYTDGVCRVAAPFVEWSKRDIWEFCAKHQVPIELTYSCEFGGHKPCGKCLSCKDKEALRVLA